MSNLFSMGMCVSFGEFTTEMLSRNKWHWDSNDTAHSQIFIILWVRRFVYVCTRYVFRFQYISTYSMCVFVSWWRVEKKGEKSSRKFVFVIRQKSEKKTTTEMNSPDDDNDPFRWHCTNKAPSNPSSSASLRRSFIFCLSRISRQFAAHVLLLVEAHPTDFIIKTNMYTHRHSHSLSPNVNKQKGYRWMNEPFVTHVNAPSTSKQDTKQFTNVVP